MRHATARQTLQMSQRRGAGGRPILRHSRSTSKCRHEAAGQADQGVLHLGAEERAATVAKEAPGCGESHLNRKKGIRRVAPKPATLRGQSAGQSADDEEDASKAQEKLGQMNKVLAPHIENHRHAVGQAQTSATQLVPDAQTARLPTIRQKKPKWLISTAHWQTKRRPNWWRWSHTVPRPRFNWQVSPRERQMLARAQALDDSGSQHHRNLKVHRKQGWLNHKHPYAQGMQSIRKAEEEGRRKGQKVPGSWVCNASRGGSGQQRNRPHRSVPAGSLGKASPARRAWRATRTRSQAAGESRRLRIPRKEASKSYRRETKRSWPSA